MGSELEQCLVCGLQNRSSALIESSMREPLLDRRADGSSRPMIAPASLALHEIFSGGFREEVS
jgi:hypothetical protein